MLASTIFAAVFAATWYVSPAGNDANDGSQGKPVASVEKAIELSRQQMKDEPKEIILDDGIYSFTNVIRLVAEDTDLTIRAKNSGKAVLSGAKEVKGWKVDPKDKRFLVADFPFQAEKKTLYSLVVNGKMADFSCYPKYGSNTKLPYIANYEDAGKGNRTAIHYDKRTLPEGYTYEDLDLTSVWLDIPQEWASTRTYIATNDWKNEMIYLEKRTDMPIGQFNQGYLIRNLRMGMTHPGTWMFESRDSKIYYWPKEGESAANIHASVSYATSIFNISGARHVTFKGLVLEGCKSPFSWGIYGCPGGILPALIGGGGPFATVVEDCELRNTAGDGICFVKPQNVVVKKTHVHDVGSGCIRYEDGGGASEIIDCDVHDNGKYALASNAIAMQTRGVKLIGTKVHHTSGCGAVLWTSGSYVASNEFYHTMRYVRDGGGVYGAMVNTKFIGNYCHDLGEWPGLYNDEGGKDCIYTGNVFDNSWWPFHMHDCRDIIFTNNVIRSDYAMRLSFQGSGSCIAKDNVLQLKYPIKDDLYKENCSVWDNEIQMKQADGTYKSAGRLELKNPVMPKKQATWAVRVKKPVIIHDKKGLATVDNGAFRTPGNHCVNCDRTAEGTIAMGVPGSNLTCGFDDEYLYIRGYYKFNQFCGYLASQSLGHVWGVHDGVKLSFEDFDIDIFTDGTIKASDGSLTFDATNSVVRQWGGVGEGQKLYAVRIPLKRLGIDAKDAYGKEIPFNATFYNADHREYKYIEKPEGPGFIAGLFGSKGTLATGKIRFEKFHQDSYALVNQKIGSLRGGNVFVGATWPFSMVQVGPDTVGRPGDDYDGKTMGFDANHEDLMGVTANHLSGSSAADLQDFLIVPFTSADPKEGERKSQHIENVWDSPSPGAYRAVLERWAMFLDSTASKRCAYHCFSYDRGGLVKVLVDTQSGAPGPNGADRITFSESTFTTNGVFEGHNRVTCWKKDRDVYAKIAFSPTPVAIRELPANGKNGKRYIAEFNLGANEKIYAKVALSNQSMEGARANFAADGDDFDFDARKAAAEAEWRQVFARFETDPEFDRNAQQRFYTAFYRTLVQPNLISDAGTADQYAMFAESDATRVMTPWHKIFVPSIVKATAAAKGVKGTYKGAIDVAKVPGSDLNELCKKYYTNKSDGLCGNDEGGRLSAWYVFACLGIYPTSEAGDTFAITTPQLNRIALTLENGKKFSVVAKGFSKENRRVQSATFNGKDVTGKTISYADIMAGGELIFEMTK